MGSVEAEAGFLDSVYEAAIAPDLWPDVLERFMTMAGASEVILAAQDELAFKTRGISIGSDPEAGPLYASHFMKCNPLLKTASPQLRVLTDEHRLDKQAFMRTEFYNDFLQRFDAHSVMWVRLAMELPRTTTISLVRPKRRDPFGDADMALARRLQPHLTRAYRMSSDLFRTKGLRNTCEALLDGSVHAVFVLDTAGIVRLVNRAGEKLIRQKQGLTLKDGILRTGRTDATNKLNALIAAACQAEHRGSGSMVLARPDLRPLSITTTPIRGERHALFGPGLSAIVCVVDPDAETPVPATLLADLFGLTPAETRVAAALLTGADSQAVAKRLGVSFFTVRNHLMHIFEKTGTRRQSELIGLLTRALGQRVE